MSAKLILAVAALALLAGACNDGVEQPTTSLVRNGPQRANFDVIGSPPGAYICSILPSPNPMSLYVNQSKTLTANQAVCDDATGTPLRFTQAFFNGNAGDTVATFGTDNSSLGYSVTVTGVGDGVTSVEVWGCCDLFGQTVAEYATINVGTVPVVVEIQAMSRGEAAYAAAELVDVSLL